MRKVTTPHNDLFVQIFSSKEKAVAFLKQQLPLIVRQTADLDHIAQVESKHLSELGVTSYNDIVYRAPFKGGQPGYYLLIIEHQSTPDAEMPIRLLTYDTAVIKDHCKQCHDTYPIPVNIVLYTGSRRWKHAIAFDQHYDHPELGAQYLHLAPFTLVQLPTDKSDPLYIDKHLGYCYAAFYCGRKGSNAYKVFQEFKAIPAFRAYFEKLPLKERIQAGTYIAIFTNDSEEELENLVTSIIINEKERKKFMRTLAQRYRQEGMLRGMQKERQQVAISMLNDHEPITKITRWTGLDQAAIEKFKKSTKR